MTGDAKLEIPRCIIMKRAFFQQNLHGLDYAGTSSGNFTLDDVKSNYQAETKQEKINRTLLVKEIGAMWYFKPELFNSRISNGR